MRLPVLGWILAAFFGGLLLGERMLRRSPGISDRLDALGVLRGKDYATIRDAAACAPAAVLPRENGERIAVWEAEGYRISLRFDAAGICLGTEEETGRSPHEKKSR